MFITIEGIDGAGKSTQIELLLKYLQSKNIDYVITREPGGCEISEKIREILLDKTVKISDKTELLLMISARAEHYEKVISPALKDNKIVICDRFIDSTIAYQGFARNMDLKTIEFLNNLATNNVKPDLTLFFDLDPEIAQQRLNKKNLDRFEIEGLNFQKKVRQGFLEVAKMDSDRVKIINTLNCSIEETHKKVLNIIEKIFM
jgi:dTMP kinase